MSQNGGGCRREIANRGRLIRRIRTYVKDQNVAELLYVFDVARWRLSGEVGTRRDQAATPSNQSHELRVTWDAHTNSLVAVLTFEDRCQWSGPDTAKRFSHVRGQLGDALYFV